MRNDNDVRNKIINIIASSFRVGITSSDYKDKSVKRQYIILRLYAGRLIFNDC